MLTRVIGRRALSGKVADAQTESLPLRGTAASHLSMKSARELLHPFGGVSVEDEFTSRFSRPTLTPNGLSRVFDPVGEIGEGFAEVGAHESDDKHFLPVVVGGCRGGNHQRSRYQPHYLAEIQEMARRNRTSYFCAGL